MKNISDEDKDLLISFFHAEHDDSYDLNEIKEKIKSKDLVEFSQVIEEIVELIKSLNKKLILSERLGINVDLYEYFKSKNVSYITNLYGIKVNVNLFDTVLYEHLSSIKSLITLFNNLNSLLKDFIENVLSSKEDYFSKELNKKINLIRNIKLKNLLIELDAAEHLNYQRKGLLWLKLLEPGDEYSEYHVLDWLQSKNFRNETINQISMNLYSMYLDFAKKYKNKKNILPADVSHEELRLGPDLRPYEVELKFKIDERTLYEMAMTEELYNSLNKAINKVGIEKIKELCSKYFYSQNNLIKAIDFISNDIDEETAYKASNQNIEDIEDIKLAKELSQYANGLYEDEFNAAAAKVNTLNQLKDSYFFTRYNDIKELFKSNFEPLRNLTEEQIIILHKIILSFKDKDSLYKNDYMLKFIINLLKNGKDINFILKCINQKSLYMSLEMQNKDHIRLALNGANNTEEFLNRLIRVRNTIDNLHNIDNESNRDLQFDELEKYPRNTKETIVGFAFNKKPKYLIEKAKDYDELDRDELGNIIPETSSPPEPEETDLEFIINGKINLDQVDTRRVMEAYLHPNFFVFLNNFYARRFETFDQSFKKDLYARDYKILQQSFLYLFIEQCNKFGINHVEFLEDLYKLNEVVKNKKITKEIKDKALKIYTNLDLLSNFGKINKLMERVEDKTLPDLNFKLDGYTFEVLPNKSIEHLTIGVYTDCCQRLGGPGESAAIDSLVNPLAGVLVLYNSQRKIIAQSYFHYVPEENGIILDNIEKNMSLARTIDLDNIYANLAIYLKQQGYSYVKCGKNYNKLNSSMFKSEAVESDPRSFSDEDVYSDYNFKDHLELDKINFDLKPMNIEKLAKSIHLLMKLAYQYYNLIKQ